MLYGTSGNRPDKKILFQKTDGWNSNNNSLFSHTKRNFLKAGLPVFFYFSPTESFILIK